MCYQYVVIEREVLSKQLLSRWSRRSTSTSSLHTLSITLQLLLLVFMSHTYKNLVKQLNTMEQLLWPITESPSEERTANFSQNRVADEDAVFKERLRNMGKSKLYCLSILFGILIPKKTVLMLNSSVFILLLTILILKIKWNIKT